MRPAVPRLLAGMAAVLATVLASAQEPKVAYYREQTFQLPFRVERGALGAIADPTAVQLHVSTDEGRTWKLYATAKPEDRSFPIRVAGDGAYQFAVRSVTPTGGLRPDRPLTPELRVVVDSQPPQIEMNAAATPEGSVVVRLRIVDPLLDVTTLRLQYQQAGTTDPWQTALVSLPTPPADGGPLTGETTFRPQLPVDRATLQVRLEIQDLAKNLGTAQMSVDWSAGARSGAEPVAAAPPPPRNVWPAESSVEPLGAAPPPPAGTREPTSTAGASPPQQPIVEHPVAPPVTSQVQAPAETSPPPAEGERPFLVNSRLFELEYELQSVGPSGVQRVGIYVTTDGGRTWSLAGSDEDRQSPYGVEVEREGFYGYRIVIVGGNGLQAPAPQPGDLAEITIGVDLTPPTARFTGATQGLHAEGPALTIQWEASDAHLDARPITLSHAAQRSGPWTTIAAGLENTGSFAWRIDPTTPEKVYLRMEVRDQAGNVQTVEPADPVVIDRSPPQGRLKAVRPRSSH